MNKIFLTVLGIAQDAGYPQAGCRNKCCLEAWNDPEKQKYAACMGIADPRTESFWLIDASPDIKYQINRMNDIYPNCKLKGIFITHAHTGHYTGLMHFGKEVMNSKGLHVYVMPEMKKFLSDNYPWKNFIDSENIILMDLKNDTAVKLNKKLFLKPIEVPHRDEHSETVGFEIISGSKKVIYISDIDSWEKWDKDITELILNSDEMFLDGTFYSEDEITDYHLKKIPHPLIRDSMKKFEQLSINHKNKINFFHLNHTNPLLKINSKERKEVLFGGFKIAYEGQTIEL